MHYSHIILGLGKTGLSCVRYLKRYYPQEDFILMDTRLNPPGLEEIKTYYPDIPIFLGKWDLSLLLKAKEIIISPGLSLSDDILQLVIKASIPIISDIELFARHVKAPVIAITGSNGKSTVTTLCDFLLKHIGLKVKTGANLGIPALDLIEDVEPDFYILELSSFQLENTYSLQPKVATILNITEDHLDRYKYLIAYANAKQRIYQGAEIAIYNDQDLLTYPHYTVPKVDKFSIDSHSTGFTLQKEKQIHYLAYHRLLLIPTPVLKIKGKHNWQNALASLCIAHNLGLNLYDLLPALVQFEGLAHRCQWIKTSQKKVHWYNDSKGTNVGATCAAIEGLGDTTRKIILILGGVAKGANFSPLQPIIEKYVAHCILIGQDAQYIAQFFKNITVPLYFALNLEEAIFIAQEKAKQNESVLFSPACASFDMFKDFEHRGETFIQLVYQYIS